MAASFFFFFFPLMVALLLVCSPHSSIASLQPLKVKGRVYCDACHAGHVTKSSFFLAGAEVAVSCVSKGGKQTAYVEGQTDNDGTFSIPIAGDHAHDTCLAGVTRSSLATCNVITRRAFATVLLNRNSGLASDVINTGPFSFKPQAVSSACLAATAYEAQPEGYYYTPAPKPPSSSSPVYQSPPPIYKPPSSPPPPVYKPPYKPPTPTYKPPSPVYTQPPPSSASPIYKPPPSPYIPVYKPPYKPSPVYQPPYKPPSASPVYKPPPSPHKPPYSSPSPVAKPPPVYEYPPSPPY